MTNYAKLTRIIVFLVLASLLLAGCWQKDYASQDDEETAHTSRTFAIADVHPYPGQDYQIPDKEVNSSYNAYIYIINNGGQDKDASADDVKLTLIDETHAQTIDVGTADIHEGAGYALFSNLSAAEPARVHLHVEGWINKNKKHDIYAKVNSNSFNISNPPPVLQSITVTPVNPSIPAGFTQTFTAAANYSDGSAADISNTADWSSSDPSKATLSGNVATGIGKGTTTITARSGGKSGTTILTVTDPVLLSISVTPADASILAGQTQTFTAMGNYSDGSTIDVSSSASWSSSNTGVAAMNGKVATGIAAGTSTITAGYEGQSASVDLTVTGASGPPPNGHGNIIWEWEQVN